MTLNSHNPLRVGTIIPIQQRRISSEKLSILLKVTQLARDQIYKPKKNFFFLSLGCFFFFFGQSWGLQDLSSPTNDWLQPLQWKPKILTTWPPGNSLVVFFLFFPQIDFIFFTAFLHPQQNQAKMQYFPMPTAPTHNLLPLWTSHT